MNKHTKILIAVFVVLLLIVIFPTLGGKNSNEKTEIKAPSINLEEFSEENTQKIIIKQEDGELLLELRNERWMMGEDEVSEKKIVAFFEDIAELEIRKLASKNQANHQKFNVDQESSISLTLTKKDKTTTFFVGKQGPTSNSFYIRKEKIANVYLVEGSLRDHLIRESSNWKEEKEENDKEGK